MPGGSTPPGDQGANRSKGSDMAVIDADSHVDESEATWAYLQPGEEQYRPQTVEITPTGNERRGYTRWWQVGDQKRIRRIRDDARTGTSVEARELHDVSARLRQMDAMGVDYHVIYPTLFIAYVTSDPATQAALCRSYNRWMADKSAESGGRLRWPVVVPTLDVKAAIDEMRWAKDKGACGLFKLTQEENRRITDEYFFPLYEEASALDYAICMHTGSGNPPRGAGDGADAGAGTLGGYAMMDAFFSVVFTGLAQKFPQLRWGFIEAGSSWIPYVLDRLWAQRQRMAWAYDSFSYDADDVRDLFRKNRLYVTCQPHEDIAYLLRFGTEDHLMIGTDFSHADQSAEIEAINIVRHMGEEGRITGEQARKILEDNPAAFYGI